MDYKHWAIVPAAGSGSRFGGQRPKQYSALNGQAVISHTLKTLLDSEIFTAVVVVLPPEDELFESLCDWAGHPKLVTVQGGATRAESVASGLRYLNDRVVNSNDFVLVHDAARPLLHPADLSALASELERDSVGGILAAPVVDTIKRSSDSESEERVGETVSRTGLWAAQTPQMFRFGILYQALMSSPGEINASVTDESMAVERAGYSPRLVVAKHSNFKITRAQDLLLAEAVLQSRRENG